MILHVYDPESHRVTCSMTNELSKYPDDGSDGVPGFTLGSMEEVNVSVIMLFVPLIHINATSSTAKAQTKSLTDVYSDDDDDAEEQLVLNVSVVETI